MGALLCLPTYNATVERLFSMMGLIKNKVRNSLAISMVEAILTTRHGILRRGETCDASADDARQIQCQYVRP